MPSLRMLSRTSLLLAAGAFLAAAPSPVKASDHADTAENFNRIGSDITDVFMFPSADTPANVVLVMDVHPFIMPGMAGNVAFDPRVLYQFKITHDLTNPIEDLVIQVMFQGANPANQKVLVAGPMKPPTVGTTSIFGRRLATVGQLGQTFSPGNGLKVFAGPREEPFFFDLERFNAIFPDRATPTTRVQVDFPSIMAANTPQKPGFRGFPPGAPGDDASPAFDGLRDMNVLSIVIELPRASLATPGRAPGVIGLWETTSVNTGSAGGFNFTQRDRLARPVVNEALATVTARRHEINDKDNPSDDAGQLKNDIESFLTFPAGRSAQIKTVIETVLVPDVMIADLSQAGMAAYLGNETGGATATDGSTFGGRKLTDDVIDMTLGVVFGPTVPALKLAPDDGAEKFFFTTDNVDSSAKNFLRTFPYLGNPH